MMSKQLAVVDNKKKRPINSISATNNNEDDNQIDEINFSNEKKSRNSVEVYKGKPLTRLPIHILAIIFGFSHEKKKDLVSSALVCKSFSEVVLKSPQLWQYRFTCRQKATSSLSKWISNQKEIIPNRHDGFVVSPKSVLSGVKEISLGCAKYDIRRCSYAECGSIKYTRKLFSKLAGRLDNFFESPQSLHYYPKRYSDGVPIKEDVLMEFKETFKGFTSFSVAHQRFESYTFISGLESLSVSRMHGKFTLDSLRGCSNLTHLELDSEYDDFTIPKEERPEIKSLCVNLHKDSFYESERILRGISSNFPELEKLELKNVRSGYVLRSTYPESTKVLKYSPGSPCFFSTRLLADFFSHNQNIEVLDIDTIEARSAISRCKSLSIPLVHCKDGGVLEIKAKAGQESEKYSGKSIIKCIREIYYAEKKSEKS